MWVYDEKTLSVKKIAQSSLSQTSRDDIDHLLFSQDEKYFITGSEKGEIRLWKHENWTTVSLVSVLPTSISSELNMRITDSNRLLIETPFDFAEYSFDANGFISLGRYDKDFLTHPTASILEGDRYFSGDMDGSIRSYSLIEAWNLINYIWI